MLSRHQPDFAPDLTLFQWRGGNGARWHVFRLLRASRSKEAMPLDFTQYLSERLGVSESDALRVLGTWLKEYEPISCLGQETPACATDARSLEAAPLARTA
jgi:hypothetical protein